MHVPNRFVLSVRGFIMREKPRRRQMKIFTEAERKTIYDLWKANTSMREITALTGASRSTVYRIGKAYGQKGNNGCISRKYVANLESKVKRLEQKPEIIKTAGCSFHAPLREKLIALEALYGKYSVHVLCEGWKCRVERFIIISSGISVTTHGMQNIAKYSARKSRECMRRATRCSERARSRRC